MLGPRLQKCYDVSLQDLYGGGPRVQEFLRAPLEGIVMLKRFPGLKYICEINLLAFW
jgi:hypothetical protein